MPTCHFSFSVPRRLADKRSDSQSTTISDNILPSKSIKSRFHSKSKEVRFDTNSEFHVYRHGTTKFSQGPSRPSRGPNSDYQISSFLQSSISTNFPFSFGQTLCSSRFCSGQTSLMTSANVSFVCLETSHSSSRSSDHDQQYDSISFELVDGSFCTRNFHSSSRSQCIPLYGCQSLRMGSSSRADETILSWSLVGRPIPAPYQYARNDGHSFHTEESHKIYSPLLCHDLRMGLGSTDCEFHIQNAQLSQCGSVCDMIQLETPIVFISSSRQPCLSSRRFFNELGSTSCICVSSFNSDTFCSSQYVNLGAE